MLTGRTDIDMGAASVAILEQRKPVEHRRGGDAVETGKHTPFTQYTDIVERCLNCCEHIANCGFGLVHQRHPSNVFHRGRGAGEGTAPVKGGLGDPFPWWEGSPRLLAGKERV